MISLKANKDTANKFLMLNAEMLRKSDESSALSLASLAAAPNFAANDKQKAYKSVEEL